MIVLRLQEEAKAFLLNRVPEWVGAGALFSLGADLSRSIDMFAVSKSYVILGSIATQRHWALVALTISSLRLVGLILNGFFPIVRRITPAVRCATAFGGAAVWLGIAAGFTYQNPSILGIVAHAGLGVLDFAYAVIVAHEAALVIKQGFHARARS